MTVLAIDQGTSATKAVVVDDGGAVIALAEAPIAVVATPDGGVELDPDELWQSVVAAGLQAMHAAGEPTLDAIGFANQGETILAWDRATGEARSRAIVWQDRRSAPLCAALAAAGPRLAELTGLELDPYFVAPKMAWLRQHVGSEATITTSDTWLLHRLCGAFVTDVATAGRSLLLDLESCTWSDEACAIFDIDAAGLAPIVGNAEAIGECDVFGRGSQRGAPITGLCVDQQAALFAESCRSAGEAKCTYGTGAFLLACTGHTPRRSGRGLVGCPAWRLGADRGVAATTWCLDGQVYTVGAAVSWLIDIGILADPSEIDALASQEPDAAGVTFVPALAGLAAPYWRPQAHAAFTGLSLGSNRAHLVRAAIDGIAAQVALLASAAAADLGAPLQRLRVDGGLTRSRALLQTQADLLQAPIEVYPSPHATALGVAQFAALGAGLAAPAETWRPAAVIEPSIGADAAAARTARWQAVAEATMDL